MGMYDQFLPPDRPLIATEEDLANWSPGGPPEPEEDTAWLSIEVPAGRTELANARRLVAYVGHMAKHVPHWSTWIVFDGKRWSLDPGEGRLLKFASEVADRVWLATRQSMTKDTIQFATSTAKHSGMRAMVNIASAMVPVLHERLDKNSMLLNCDNGTLDLTNGTLRRHDAADMLTKLCPTVFDPAAECPIWDKFLLDVFDQSTELVQFVRRLCGYWLTGRTDDHILPICHGTGANGKTTLFNAILQVMGEDYSMQAQPTLLVERKGESHPTERADLFGKRLVVASESEGNAKLAESMVKSLTGGDKIRARRMRENFWEFSPTHKLAMLTNHLPRVRGQDHGIWRRLVKLPFNQVFEGDRADKRLPEKLTAEASGILAWMVRGCLEWQQDGLNPPAEVTSATRDYKSSQDTYGRFVMERCVIGSSDFVVKFSDLREEMERWCKDTGEIVPSAKQFGQWLQDQGCEPFQSNGRRYRGIGLQE